MSLYDQADNLRDAAYAAGCSDEAQQELICRLADLVKTMAHRIEELERDFSAACLEVARLTYQQNTETYDTSREFDTMTNRRGIEYP